MNQLDNLEKRLNNLGKKGIKIDTKDLKDLENIKIPEIKIDKIDTQKARKEFKQLEKDIAKGAKTIDGEYTNTLAGLRAQLRDMKQELSTLDLNVDSEAFQTLTEDIKELNDQVKQIEEDYGTFSRNVGNYTESMIDALNEFDGQMYETVEGIEDAATSITDKWKNVKNAVEQGLSLNVNDVKGVFSIKQVEDELKKVSDELSNTVNDDDYAKLKKYYDELKRVSEEFKHLRTEAEKTDNKLKTQITRTINGQVYTWETLTSAVGELEDKLYQLAANGARNTDEFREIAKAAAELKTQLKSVDVEIDAMAESSKGVRDLVSLTQGFTAIAQGANGIGQLFGMDSENAMKGIQTMMALQGVASALQAIQEQTKQDTAFGKMMKDWSIKLETFLFGVEAVRQKWIDFTKILTAPIDIKSFNELEVKINGISTKIKDLDPDKIAKITTGFRKMNQDATTFIKGSRKLRNEYSNLIDVIQGFGGKIENGGFIGLYEAVIKLNAEGKITTDQFDKIKTKIDGLTDSFNKKNKITLFDEAKATFNDILESLGIISSTAPKAATAIDMITKSIKLLGKATLLLIGFQLLIEAIGWITSIISKTYDWVRGNDKLVNSLSKVETEINLVNKSIEKYSNNLSRLTNNGVIKSVDELALKYEKLQLEILKAAKALKEFSELRGGGKSLEEGTKSDNYTWFGKASDIDGIDDAKKRLEEFRKVYDDLQKAVEAGTDETGKRGKGWWNLDIFNWFTKSDAKADLGEMQKQVINDLQNQINNLDLSKGTEELKKFYELLQDPMYASSLANVENLYPEEEWAQVLKKRVEQVVQMYEQMDEAAKDSADAQLAEQNRLLDESMQRLSAYNEQQRRVRNNLTEAIGDENKRELEALFNAEADEIEAARKQGEEMLKLNADKVDVQNAVEQEIASIKKKYRRLEVDMLKKHQKELEDAEWDITQILRQIRDNRLSAEKESLDKHLQELENERQDAIEDALKEAREAAKEGHNLTELYNELVLSINIKYDALVKKEKEKYYQELLDMQKEYARAMVDVQNQINADNLDVKKIDVDVKYNSKLNSSEGSYDFNGNYIQEEKKFNQERLKIELDYLEEKKKLDEEFAKFDNNDALQQEKNRYEDALRRLRDFKEEGKATEEEYNRLVEQEEELHNQHVSRINQKYQNDLTTINNEYLVERKSMVSQSLVDNASLYQHYADEVSDIMSKVGKDINVFGILDYGKTKEQLDKAKQVIIEGIANIDAELKNLEKKRKSGQISFIDYKQAKEELEKTKEVLESQGQDITTSMKTLLGEVCSQWKGLVDSWVSQVSSLLTTMNDTQMQLIDNQMKEIEHQLELQEEAYERAEEAAQKHKDNMEGIEGELENARGERRLFLLEQLAAQQLAYEKDYAAQQKAAKQKEILEKKQEALEKKRNEQEKKAKVQQAMINTYMAVSNALAVSPWFLGLALSAVALGLGLKNVAAIKATPIYEDGGVIQGASHSQGGVKVLGGQAEVEGGEFITNKLTTAKNVDVLTFINSKKKKLDLTDFVEFYSSGSNTHSKTPKFKYAAGGQLPTMQAPQLNVRDIVNTNNMDNRPIYVSVTEIENVQNRVRNVRAIAGMED